MKKKELYFAILISHILDPLVTLGVVSIIGVLISGLNQSLILPYLVIVIIGTIVPLVFLRWWGVKTKKIGDWDIRNRKQRFVPLVVILVILIVHFVIARFFIDDFLVHLTTLYIVWVSGILSITMFWKISGHAAGVTLACGLIISWFGWNWWPVLLSIPLVGWARVTKKDHTVPQVVAGALYSLGVLFITSRI